MNEFDTAATGRIHHVRRTWSSPVYVHLRKHFCPDCAARLKPVRVSRVVRAGSAEAKELDLTQPGGDNAMVGNIKWIHTEFRCPRCGGRQTIARMRQLEKK